MAKKTEQITTNNTGIYFRGIVSERRRRKVPKDNPITEVVTYTFYDEENHTTYFVDDYAPEDYLEKGEYVDIPVRIKAYVNKGTGRPAYSMTIRKAFERQDSNNSNGEVF